jgi:hypothetical protein
MSLTPVPPLPDDALTPADLAKPATVGMIMQAVDAIMAAVESRIAAVEARPSVKYCGVHEPGRSYAAGSLTTRQGSLWCATKSTSDVPGEGRTDWLLVVKRGGAI